MRSREASTCWASTSTWARSFPTSPRRRRRSGASPTFAAECRDELGWEARVVDLGGGFGIRHHPDEDVPDAAELATAAVGTARELFAAAALPEPSSGSSPGARSSGEPASPSTASAR